PAAVPTASDDVCIEAPSFNVVGITDAAVAHSVTIGTSSSPVIDIFGVCGANASLTVGGPISIGSTTTVNLGSVNCGNSATLSAGTSTIDSAGTIAVLAGATGARSLVCNLSNSGTLSVAQPLTLSGALTNT